MANENIFEVQDTFFIAGRGLVVAGELKAGSLKIGMKTTVNNKSSEIIVMEEHRKQIDFVSEIGSRVAISLSNITKEDITSPTLYFV